MIQSYWVKKLTALSEHLAARMNHLLRDGAHQERLTKGRRVLIMKDPQKGTNPSNYKPVTCLCIISAKMRHVAYEQCQETNW